jgi:predicted  nucleic acid-binding Zn-ribbon protein
MYSVVGCNGCSNLWIIGGRPETTRCPRCGKRRTFEKLKKFVETDDEDHAREVRASMLANRQGHGEAFAELDSFAEMDSYADEAGMDDDEFLDRSGVDSEEVDAAANRDARRSTSTSKKQVVLDALTSLDRPTEGEVVGYASERGVSSEYVETALAKLARRGEISESRGRYRRI